MMTVGFIGLGRMGLPMASNLCRKGFQLTVYDIDSAAITSMEQQGARAGTGVADVARASDVIVTMLPDSAAVEEVITGANGVLAHARDGAVIMDMSTVAPALTDHLANAARLGLSLRKTLDVLYGTTAVNGQLQIAWPAKVLKGDIEPGFTIDLAHKDLTLIVDAANAAKVPMPIGSVAREAFSIARARGYGGKDFSAMVDSLCDLADIEKPRLTQQE